MSSYKNFYCLNFNLFSLIFFFFKGPKPKETRHQLNPGFSSYTSKKCSTPNKTIETTYLPFINLIPSFPSFLNSDSPLSLNLEPPLPAHPNRSLVPLHHPSQPPFFGDLTLVTDTKIKMTLCDDTLPHKANNSKPWSH